MPLWWFVDLQFTGFYLKKPSLVCIKLSNSVRALPHLTQWFDSVSVIYALECILEIKDPILPFLHSSQGLRQIKAFPSICYPGTMRVPWFSHSIGSKTSQVGSEKISTRPLLHPIYQGFLVSCHGYNVRLEPRTIQLESLFCPESSLGDLGISQNLSQGGFWGLNGERKNDVWSHTECWSGRKCTINDFINSLFLCL